MTEKCHTDVLRLIILCSLLKVTSGQKEIHVFSSDGENVHLPCHNVLTDCTSTTWTYYNKENSRGVSLFAGGTKMIDTERRERLSLGSDCFLNIYKATTEDHGVYQFGIYGLVYKQTACTVYLHILHVSPLFTQSEMRQGNSVTLSCRLYVYDTYPCETLFSNERLQLIWVNESGVNLQTDSRYQISSSEKHCNISLTTKLLNEDDNKEWKCQMIKGSEVKTSVSYTVTYLVSSAKTLAGLSLRVIIFIIEIALLTAPTYILLRIICKGRADNRRRALDTQNTVI